MVDRCICIVRNKPKRNGGNRSKPRWIMTPRKENPPHTVEDPAADYEGSSFVDLYHIQSYDARYMLRGPTEVMVMRVEYT